MCSLMRNNKRFYATMLADGTYLAQECGNKNKVYFTKLVAGTYLAQACGLH